MPQNQALNPDQGLPLKLLRFVCPLTLMLFFQQLRGFRHVYTSIPTHIPISFSRLIQFHSVFNFTCG